MKQIVISLVILALGGCTQLTVNIPSGDENTVTININKDKDLSLTPITSVSSGAASATGTGGNIK